MEKDLTTFYDGNPFQILEHQIYHKVLCKEQKHKKLGCIPRFKTSAGFEPDISSASTVANCNE